jgi:hypothetical protein
MNKNTKSAGRPAAQLVYPSGPFTVKQLYALNKRRVKWELSIRQHIDRAIEARWISKTIAKVHTGQAGKPAHLFSLTKWGQAKLNVKGGSTPIKTPITIEVPTPAPAVEIPLTEAVATPTTVVEVSAPTSEAIVEATMAALAPVI